MIPRLLLSVSLLLSTAVSGAAPDEVRAILESRCLGCHSAKEQKGDLDLETSDIRKEPQVWEHVLEQIEIGEMPPKKESPLSEEEKLVLTGWVSGALDEIALANAGDPGPVVLRRLSNEEYTYTIRDLTGVDSLDPVREFPVDGAAGEGFTNAGAALVMSPALLTKYLDAAKEIAAQAVLLPDGIRFSPSDSSQDWTDETLTRIRKFYERFTVTSEITSEVAGTGKVTTERGGIPLEDYLGALQGRGSGNGLSPKYVQILRGALGGGPRSVLMDPLRKKFREGTLAAADIEIWQEALWRFASVGHIGKENGPKAWQEPVTPLVASQEMRMKLTGERDLTLYLVTTEAGDGDAGDEVVWGNPRVVVAGRPDLPLDELPVLLKHLENERAKILNGTEACLAAIADGRDDVDAGQLHAWRETLGYGTTRLEPLLVKKLEGIPDYDFIKGWTGEEALSVIANSSDLTVRTPGTMKGHSIATHPSPTLAAVIAWRCESPATLQVRGDVTDAHTDCGNGVAWSLEIRRGHSGEILAAGETKGSTVLSLGPFEDVRLGAGDVVALVIGPRAGSHVCDLTAVNLTISDGTSTWDLAKDVSPDILAGNPHGPWHFLGQPATLEAATDLPTPLTEWMRAPSSELAAQVRKHLERDFPLTSPLLATALRSFQSSGIASDRKTKAPSVIEVAIPAVLAKDSEFLVTGRLASETVGSVQMRVMSGKPTSLTGLVAVGADSTLVKGQWSDNNLRTRHTAPVIVNEGSEARKRFEAAFEEFRALFPIALCYPRIVPVDEVVTLTLFHREDEPLKRLILDEAESRELDRLWGELLFVSEAPLKQVDVFEQLYQFATQDSKPSAFEPMREPILNAAESFRRRRIEAEPRQVNAVIDFAGRAWRRPLDEEERGELLDLYETIRDQGLSHPQASRLLLARVLVAPDFLYRGEKAAPGRDAAPVSNHELATRLSYFLWSSTPDEELLGLAAAGKLHDPDVLAAQARRLTKDGRVRRLATEFGCQWLHIRDLETLEEKSERHFPTFLGLRDDMQEEAVLFFVDLFQNDRSVLSLIDADHTFVNAPLAAHYGIALKGENWQRIEGLRASGRGGILGFAATLAKQSGASRTSAILRGTWLSEVILGDKLPNPPKGVPVLPEEAPEGLTERQLTERHSRDERCAGCHKRVDPFGFALEGFDAIGRTRAKDAAGLSIDTRTALPDGTPVDGLDGLRTWLVEEKGDEFLHQFSRKLLGYALGRGVQLSDKPLLDEIVAAMKSDKDRVGIAVEKIVLSPQFREVRGRDSEMN